jgi:polysaccharide export outer membrane protein
MNNKLLCLIVFGVCFGLLGGHATAQTSRPHYLIGPGDILYIHVWKEPDLTQEEVPVMSDGRITFPLIGEVMAEGQTLSGLKDIITEKLSHFVKATEVTVILKKSYGQRIYTIGKLNAPGPYPLEPDMTVIQALSTAGGFAEWADTEKIRVIRRKGGTEVQYKFDYKDYISGKKMEQNIVLEPNDTIVVP